jgi:hypothetical protein
MPITKNEFENGKIHSTLEEEIIAFLNERKNRAFTSQEIMEGLRYHAEFSTPEISKMSTFAVADFTTFLHHLVERGKIKMKIVRGRMYLKAAESQSAKCPKCGGEITNPKRTWNMTGRPDKKGEKLQLQIGLYHCPKHGSFRTVLSKQKVAAGTNTVIPKVKKAIKRSTRRVKTKAEKKKRKSSPWLLI